MSLPDPVEATNLMESLRCRFLLLVGSEGGTAAAMAPASTMPLDPARSICDLEWLRSPDPALADLALRSDERWMSDILSWLSLSLSICVDMTTKSLLLRTDCWLVGGRRPSRGIALPKPVREVKT
jgi:hypothetical protein